MQIVVISDSSFFLCILPMRLQPVKNNPSIAMANSKNLFFAFAFKIRKHRKSSRFKCEQVMGCKMSALQLIKIVSIKHQMENL